MTKCPCCGSDIADAGRICHRCTGRLRRHLLDVPALLAELTTTALRQSKTGDGQGGSASIPWNERARQAQHAIRNAIATWARLALDDWDDQAEYLVGPALWLADRTNWIRMRSWADDCATDIDHVMRAGWRAIDRPEDRWYAGPCGGDRATSTGTLECAWTLWARLDQVNIICPQCGTSWRVDARREWLLTAADDVWETAPTIASALTIMLRVRVSPSSIRKWAWRGDLQPVGERGNAKLYRVGDVITLVNRRDTTTDTPHPGQELTSA